VSERTPRVSIGLPVFNGERYLARALDSLVAQDFEDFELIISDNASTDGTSEICQEYAGRDRRINVHRNERNIGAVGNFNRTLQLSSGDYFKWAAHDDWCAPEFLSRCVEVLDEDPSMILCFTAMGVADAEGRVFRVQREDLCCGPWSTAPVRCLG
jgi:glycosyltransferase involved in cell wall biosynthesis